MARQPRDSAESGTPGAPAVTTPENLYPTSDIRFVMQAIGTMHHSIGELTANVNRLIADGKSQGDKLDTLRHQATYIKGALAASVVLIGVFVAVSTFFLSARWDAAVQALRAIANPN